MHLLDRNRLGRAFCGFFIHWKLLKNYDERMQVLPHRYGLLKIHLRKGKYE